MDKERIDAEIRRLDKDIKRMERWYSGLKAQQMIQNMRAEKRRLEEKRDEL